jgi:hypothetical protein
MNQLAHDERISPGCLGAGDNKGWVGLGAQSLAEQIGDGVLAQRARAQDLHLAKGEQFG